MGDLEDMLSSVGAQGARGSSSSKGKSSGRSSGGSGSMVDEEAFAPALTCQPVLSARPVPNRPDPAAPQAASALSPGPGSPRSAAGPPHEERQGSSSKLAGSSRPLQQQQQQQGQGPAGPADSSSSSSTPLAPAKQKSTRQPLRKVSDLVLAPPPPASATVQASKPSRPTPMGGGSPGGSGTSPPRPPAPRPAKSPAEVAVAGRPRSTQGAPTGSWPRVLSPVPSTPGVLLSPEP